MAAKGFLEAQHMTGGAPHVGEYRVKSGETIYPGDLVKMTSGTIEHADAVTDLIYGVAACYSKYGEQEFRSGLVDGPAWNHVRVYDDLPNTIFVAEGQHASATTENIVGAVVPFAVGAGDATLETSGDYVDIDGTSDPDPDMSGVKILGRYGSVVDPTMPDWGGTKIKVRCQIVSLATGGAIVNLADDVWVTTSLTDVSTASSSYVIAPITGTITTAIYTISAAITGADAGVELQLGNTQVTGSHQEITQSGSAPGDSYTVTCTAANAVTAGDIIELTSDGDSSTTSILFCAIAITPA